ncbi:MAG: hypothetical protein WEE89_03985 [Gemmatimonadota bacterium]
MPLAGGVIAWFVNESRKRSWEEYQRKEERYRELLRTSRGFYVGQEDSLLKAAFLEQIALCWLYCPDEVIRKAYVFLEAVKTGSNSTTQQRDAAFGDFVAAIRADLLSRKLVKKTSLSGKDYRHFTPTVKS